MLPLPAQKQIIAQASQPAGQTHTIMGDRSPKAVHKKANQKQTATNSANQKKQQATAAKQAAGAKK
jgi:hypothetical protein